MTRCSTQSQTIKNVKGYGFSSFTKNLSNKYRKKLQDTPTKARLDALKTAAKISS